MAEIRDLPKVEAVLKVGKAKFAVLNLHYYREFIQKIALGGRIDEDAYLRKYPDVAEAIRAKKVGSATEHYLKWGYLEKREATLASEMPSNVADYASRAGTKFGQR